MREGVGEIFTYNLIIIFIVIVFGLLAATLNYYKAFKVNARILDIIEKYEGYNSLAKEEIARDLQSIGYAYNAGEVTCQAKRGDAELVSTSNNNVRQDEEYAYCVYYYEDDRGGNDKNKENGDGEPIYYNYSVVTYIYVDLPIVDNFKIPVYTKGERTYNFTERSSASGWKKL